MFVVGGWWSHNEKAEPADRAQLDLPGATSSSFARRRKISLLP
jgi:hypothetical protein